MSRFANNALQGVGSGFRLENKDQKKIKGTANPLLETQDISLNNSSLQKKEAEGKWF